MPRIRRRKCEYRQISGHLQTSQAAGSAVCGGVIPGHAIHVDPSTFSTGGQPRIAKRTCILLSFPSRSEPRFRFVRDDVIFVVASSVLRALKSSEWRLEMDVDTEYTDGRLTEIFVSICGHACAVRRPPFSGRRREHRRPATTTTRYRPSYGDDDNTIQCTETSTIIR